MTATASKPLDLAQFDDMGDRCRECRMDFVLARDADALLAECKRQREQIQALREALQWLADECNLVANRGHMSHATLKQARAALAKVSA